MRNQLPGTLLITALLCLCCCSSTFAQQTTAFTYQGRLTDGGNPANGNYDLQFALYDGAGDSAAQIATMPPINGVPVTNSIFTVQLDFGAGAFPGANRFLQISVRHNSNEAFVPLTPRQPITSNPYAIRSLNATAADTATNASQLGGVAANQYVVTTDSRLSDSRPPTAGSANYIQNTTSFQPNSNFNISGDGSVFGTLSGGRVNAALQYNLGGNRILSTFGADNLFAGIGTGIDSNGNPGSSNSFFGPAAGSGINGGTNNSFFGWRAGQHNTTGGENVFVGDSAAGSNLTGSRNTTVGAFSDVADNLQYATAIGSGAKVTQSNSLVLGSIKGVNNSNSDTNVGIGTTAPQARLHVVGAQATQLFGPGHNVLQVVGAKGLNSGSIEAGGDGEGVLIQAGDGGDGPVLQGSGGSITLQPGRAGTGQVYFGDGQVIIHSLGRNGLSVTTDTPGGLLSSFGGIGDFRVDAPNTPGGRFIIKENGSIGINTPAPNARLHITDNSGNILFGNGGCSSGFAGLGFASTLTCANYSLLGDGTNTIINRPTGGAIAFRENNQDQMLILTGGVVQINNLGSAGATQLCRNAANQISTCSSSLRYKTNIAPFSSGLSFIKQLRPITFDWKQSGLKDVGFGAEDVARVNPLFVTYNDKGEVEGVKYDRLSAAFVNAFQEQQKQIEELKQQVRQLQAKARRRGNRH